MAREPAPIDARTTEELASRKRTIKTVAGFCLDVHEHAVLVCVDGAGGDSVCLPRRVFDHLITWYVGGRR